MDRITTEIKDFVKSKTFFNEPGAVILQPDCIEKKYFTLQNGGVAVLLLS